MERKGTGDVKDRKEQGDGRHKKRERLQSFPPAECPTGGIRLLRKEQMSRDDEIDEVDDAK